MALLHKDVLFVVEVVDSRVEARHFDNFDEAAGRAVTLAAMEGPTHLDVLVYSKAGARAWGDDDAVEEYLADPEASVHERFVVKVDAQGRIA